MVAVSHMNVNDSVVTALPYVSSIPLLTDGQKGKQCHRH